MIFAGSTLMILTGLALMAFGLLLFYAWLPLLYGFVGFDIGLLLGKALTGDVGTISVILGICGALLLGIASYALEPYRRLLIGVSAGVLLGLSIPGILGLTGPLSNGLGIGLAVLFGVIGSTLVQRYFDSFIVVSSAISGAILIVAGLHFLFPGILLFDLTAGGFAPRLLTAILAVVGIGWQLSNISNWAASIKNSGVPEHSKTS
jgi:hypothetical protein